MGDQRRLNRSHGAKLGWHKIKTNEVIDKLNEHTDELSEHGEQLDQHDRDIRFAKHNINDLMSRLSELEEERENSE